MPDSIHCLRAQSGAGRGLHVEAWDIMANLSRIRCRSCGEAADVMHNPSGGKPTICGPCRKKENSQKRENHLSELGDLPIEERLRRIEAWIYDYRPQYVEPPRF